MVRNPTTNNTLPLLFSGCYSMNPFTAFVGGGGRPLPSAMYLLVPKGKARKIFTHDLFAQD